MIKSDYHLHSTFSDGRDSIEMMCARAAELGITEVCFTEHIDFDVNDPHYGCYDDAGYSKSIKSARRAFAGVLAVAKGCEFDFSTTYGADYAGFLAPLEFDFILGSVHNVFGLHIGWPQLLEYSPRRLYTVYFDQVRALVETGLCHALGHFDYLYKLTAEQWESDPRDRWYWRQVDEVLRLCVQKDIGIEVNTADIEAGRLDPAAQPEILHRYHDLGGKIVTVGSDGHSTESLGWGLDAVEKILHHAGFNEIAVFRNGSPVFRPI